VPTISKTNCIPWVGKVPGETGTFALAASDPAMARTGTKTRNLPHSIAKANVRLKKIVWRVPEHRPLERGAEAKLVRLLALSKYFPLAPAYCGEYGERLLAAGILEPTADGRLFASDLSIPRIVWHQNRAEFVDYLEEYFADHPDDLAMASRHLMSVEFGGSAFAGLMERNPLLFSQQMRSLAASEPRLFAILLTNMRAAARDLARTLLRGVMPPGSSANRVLIVQILDLRCSHPITTYRAFFEAMHKLDRYLMSGILWKPFRSSLLHIRRPDRFKSDR
jgi:hypothetical protein